MGRGVAAVVAVVVAVAVAVVVGVAVVVVVAVVVAVVVVVAVGVAVGFVAVVAVAVAVVVGGNAAVVVVVAAVNDPVHSRRLMRNSSEPLTANHESNVQAQLRRLHEEALERWAHWEEVLRPRMVVEAEKELQLLRARRQPLEELLARDEVALAELRAAPAIVARNVARMKLGRHSERARSQRRRALTAERILEISQRLLPNREELEDELAYVRSEEKAVMMFWRRWVDSCG